MFALTLPRDEKSGRCRINGQEAQFKIEDDLLSFRFYDGSPKWDERLIVHIAPVDGELVTYLCSDANGDEAENIFAEETMSEDLADDIFDLVEKYVQTDTRGAIIYTCASSLIGMVAALGPWEANGTESKEMVEFLSEEIFGAIKCAVSKIATEMMD